MILMLLFSIAGYSPFLILRNEGLVTQEMCNANGVPNLYQQIQNEYKQASNCSITDLVSRLINDDNLSNYIKDKCAARSKSQTCTANAISLSKQCLNPQDIKLLKTWEKIDEQFLDYMCKNYLENLTVFGATEYKCWEDVSLALRKKCSQNMYTIMNSGPYGSMNKFTCSDFEDVELCLRNNFPKYCNDQIRDIVLTAIKIIGSNVCETTNHINEHKRLRRSVILRRIVRDIGVTNKFHKLEHKVKNVCITNGHTSEKLEQTLEEMKECIAEKKMFLVPKQEYLHHMEKCSNKSIELFKSCLPNKYKYIPPLFFNIAESMISFLYDDFMIITSELGPCIPKLNTKESTEEYNKCVDKILIEDELVDSKEKFCQSWIPVNTCYIKQIQKDCKPSDELTKFEKDFMAAITNPCNNK